MWGARPDYSESCEQFNGLQKKQKNGPLALYGVSDRMPICTLFSIPFGNISFPLFKSSTSNIN